MKGYYKEEVILPESVNCEIGNNIIISKDQIKLERRLPAISNIIVEKSNNKIIMFSNKKSRKYKKQLYTTLAHIKNMIKGVNSLFLYKLKICSGHFPMSVRLDKNFLVISNFLGEKIPRKAFILPEVKVNVNGDIITVESHNLESAGQTAANIEIATKIKNKDRRIFQDGIYITEKPK